MFNGHMDTSYSGREPWLAARAGLPAERVRRGRAALRPRHLEHEGRARLLRRGGARARSDAGVRLRGDVLIAAVCGEIEKTQYGDAQGAEYRGYAAGSRYLVSHGGVADMCILGEPTEGKVVLGHFGVALAADLDVTGTSSTRRSARGSATRTRSCACTRCSTPCWSGSRPGRTTRRTRYRGAKAIVNVGAIEGGFGWRVSRTPHRTDLFLDVRVPPTKPMAVARARGARDGARPRRALPRATAIEGEVYVTAPGAEIDEGHPLVGAIDAAHAEVFGAPPERDVTRWFSDASVLTRYGIPTVNYGTSTGLMDTSQGREPRDRRAREDGRGVRARRDARLRRRVSIACGECAANDSSRGRSA